MSVTWKLITQLQHLPQMINKTKTQIWTQRWWTSTIKQKGQSHWWRSTKKQLVGVLRRNRSKNHQRMSGRGNILGSPGTVKRIWQLGGRMLNLTLKTCLKVYLLGFLLDHSRETFCKALDMFLGNMLHPQSSMFRRIFITKLSYFMEGSAVKPHVRVW